jgi:hypothetical protein
MHSTPRLIRSALLGTTLSLALVGSGCSNSESGSSPGGSTGSAGKASASSVANSGSGGSNGGKSSASSAGEAGKGGSSASGGASAKGGSTQTSSAAGGSCPAATTCAGGDVVGTWTVSSSGLKISGEIEMTTYGAKCKTAKVTGSLQVTGSFTARANKSYLDNTVTTGEEQIELEPDCLIISSTPTDCSGAAGLLKGGLGLDSLECTPVTGGGCTCKGTVKQDGMMGVPSGMASPDGSYKASGNVLTYDDMLDYSYCVAGDKLTVTPKPTAPTFTGSIVLQKSPTGTGGTGGQTTGGSKASGGTTSGGQVTGGTRTGGTSAAGGAAGGTSAAGGTTGAAGGTGTAGPCDIYAAANNPCVAAHSVVRALFGAYRGKLYQIAKSDGTTLDVLTGADGIADTKPEDTFCTGTTCSLTVIYDQTKNASDLWWQGSEQVPAPKSSTAAKATADPVNVGGHKVYSAFIKAGNCYWHDGSKKGMAIGAEPEGMYMVSSARNTNGGCCFDYGNSETTRAADVGGAMDAINVSSITAWGTGGGSGPWIMADMEWGLFCQQDNKKNSSNPTQTAPFLTAFLKNNGTTEYALKGGDATVSTVPSIYKGKGPYNPMKKQGAIILGCGGDCCKPCSGCGSNASSGIFFEGAIVKGYPTDATEEEVHKNIAAVGYGK